MDDIREELLYKILHSVRNSEYGTLETNVKRVLKEYTFDKRFHCGVGTFQRDIDIFLIGKRAEGLKDSTLCEYNYNLKVFMRYINKGTNDIRADDIRSYVSHLVNDCNSSDSTIITRVRTLRSFFQWLLSEDIIDIDPTSKCNFSKYNKPSYRTALTPEQFIKFELACETLREKALVEFLISTGCRVGEVIRIKVNDVDFNQRSVNIIGKGDKRRIVYFSVKAKVLLERYIETRPKGCDSLFTTSFNNNPTPLSHAALQAVIKVINKRANLGINVHAHLLRHTFATNAISKGVDVVTLAQLLGHADLSTTQIYITINQSNIYYLYNRHLAY